MEPESGAETYLRFVQGPAYVGYEPLAWRDQRSGSEGVSPRIGVINPTWASSSLLRY